MAVKIISRRCSYDYFAYHSDAPTATLTTYQVMAVKMMPLLSATERSEVEALTDYTYTTTTYTCDYKLLA